MGKSLASVDRTLVPKLQHSRPHESVSRSLRILSRTRRHPDSKNSLTSYDIQPTRKTHEFLDAAHNREGTRSPLELAAPLLSFSVEPGSLALRFKDDHCNYRKTFEFLLISSCCKVILFERRLNCGFVCSSMIAVVVFNFDMRLRSPSKTSLSLIASPAGRKPFYRV